MSKDSSKSPQRQWQVADVMEYGLLKDNAKANRKNMTEAESAFWSLAKGCGLGEKCRRQYVIGQYIVDFFFRKSMLIVEIDGGYHRPSQCSETGDSDMSKTTIIGDILIDSATLYKDKNSWANNPNQIKSDKERQDWLEQNGYTILRFTNEQILFDTENSIQKIKKYLSL